MPDNSTGSSANPDGSSYANPNPNQDMRGGLIQSPKINKAGKPTQHSIKDAGMARDVIKTVIQASRVRQIVNSRILAKYNAERPYDNSKLEAEGLGWRQNFTTKPLPLMIEKVAPRFTEAVNNLKYFTSAKLAEKWENSTQKAEKFREIITKTIRSRKGFRTLVEDIAFDNALFGHSIVAWLDEFSWFPKHFKQDEHFLPDGTKQEVRFNQMIVMKEIFLPHELFRHIEDKEAAKTVGWNVEDTIKAVNEASPAQIRDRLNVGGTLETWYQNAQRELTIGASYMAGASVIVVYSLFAREVTGKVSHYRLAGPGLDEIFSKDDRFESMEDCASFFAFQKGNGTMHGSKGIGRDIYELAGMIDRTRNEIVDRSIMSGKTLIQGDMKNIHRFKMSVVGMTVIIPDTWKVLEQKIDGNIEPFIKLDAYFSLLVDQLIGSTSPRNFGGERTTAAEVNLFAQREEEGKDVRITRFLEQFCDMVGTMQKRIIDPETVDEDAKEAQKKLLELMTREEIKELADQPVAETVRDLTPQLRQLIVAVANEKKGNPLYNQRQLEIEDLTARVDANFAERVLLPTNDPTEEAEQKRMQDLEIMLLSSGHPVPVSPRDNDEIHLAVLAPAVEQMAQHLMEGQFHTDSFEAMIAHLTEHYNRAIQKGVPKDKLAQIADVVKNAGPQLAKLKELDAQAEQLSQQKQAHDQEMAGGAPPQPQTP